MIQWTSLETIFDPVYDLHGSKVLPEYVRNGKEVQAQKHSTSYLLFMDIYGRFGKNIGQPLLHSSFLINKTWLPSDCARETSAACPGTMGQNIRRDYPLATCCIAMENGHLVR
jgi:hypothetical protein